MFSTPSCRRRRDSPPRTPCCRRAPTGAIWNFTDVDAARGRLHGDGDVLLDDVVGQLPSRRPWASPTTRRSCRRRDRWPACRRGTVILRTPVEPGTRTRGRSQLFGNSAPFFGLGDARARAADGAPNMPATSGETPTSKIGSVGKSVHRPTQGSGCVRPAVAAGADRRRRVPPDPVDPAGARCWPAGLHPGAAAAGDDRPPPTPPAKIPASCHVKLPSKLGQKVSSGVSIAAMPAFPQARRHEWCCRQMWDLPPLLSAKNCIGDHEA